MVRSIEHGYGFLFREPLTILGLAWLPAAFYAVACSFWLHRMATAMLISVRPVQGTLNDFAFFDFLGLLLATAFFGAALAAPLTRAALGAGDERALAHFVFGWREARLFLALLRFYALLLAVLFGLTMIAGIAVTTALPHLAASWRGMSMAGMLNSAVGLLLAASFLFLSVRFGFFLAPAAASGHPTGLLPAWNASRGNGWRLLIVYLAIAMPLLILLAAFGSLVWGLPLGALFATLWPGAHDAVARYQYLYDHAGSFAVAGGVVLVLFHALFAGASALAYQAVAKDAQMEDAPAPVESVWTPHPAFADYRARPAERFERPAAPEMTQAAVPAPPFESTPPPASARAFEPVSRETQTASAETAVVPATLPPQGDAAGPSPDISVPVSPPVEIAPQTIATAPPIEAAPSSDTAVQATAATAPPPAAPQVPPPDPGAFAATASNGG